MTLREDKEMSRLTQIYLCLVLLMSSIVGQAGQVGQAETETIAVIGTGDMGDSLGPRFADLGYKVIYGSRNPDSEKLKAIVKRTGINASATTQAAAAQQGDIVLLLVPWPAMETVAQSLGNLDAKVVIDVSMPFKQGDDGYPQHML